MYSSLPFTVFVYFQILTDFLEPLFLTYTYTSSPFIYAHIMYTS